MNNCSPVKYLLKELMELEVVYGYMLLNAPTEEARRMTELNLITVRNTKDILTKMYNDLTGNSLPLLGEILEEVPVFADFMEAARYAFKEELQVIHLLKELYLATETCHHNSIFGCIVEHQSNAMRLLYLDL